MGQDSNDGYLRPYWYSSPLGRILMSGAPTFKGSYPLDSRPGYATEEMGYGRGMAFRARMVGAQFPSWVAADWNVDPASRPKAITQRAFEEMKDFVFDLRALELGGSGAYWYQWPEEATLEPTFPGLRDYRNNLAAAYERWPLRYTLTRIGLKKQGLANNGALGDPLDDLLILAFDRCEDDEPISDGAGKVYSQQIYQNYKDVMYAEVDLWRTIFKIDLYGSCYNYRSGAPAYGAIPDSISRIALALRFDDDDLYDDYSRDFTLELWTGSGDGWDDAFETKLAEWTKADLGISNWMLSPTRDIWWLDVTDFVSVGTPSSPTSNYFGFKLSYDETTEDGTGTFNPRPDYIEDPTVFHASPYYETRLEGALLPSTIEGVFAYVQDVASIGDEA